MVSTASGVDAPQEDTDGDIQGRDSSEILLKIQAMLDTTKVYHVYVMVHSHRLSRHF